MPGAGRRPPAFFARRHTPCHSRSGIVEAMQDIWLAAQRVVSARCDLCEADHGSGLKHQTARAPEEPSCQGPELEPAEGSRRKLVISMQVAVLLAADQQGRKLLEFSVEVRDGCPCRQPPRRAAGAHQRAVAPAPDARAGMAHIRGIQGVLMLFQHHLGPSIRDVSAGSHAPADGVSWFMHRHTCWVGAQGQVPWVPHQVPLKKQSPENQRPQEAPRRWPRVVNSS